MCFSAGFCVLFVLSVSYVCAKHVHDHKKNEHVGFHPFEEVLETFNRTEGQNLTKANLESVIEELFVHRFGCTDDKVHPTTCMTCLTADNIITVVKADANFGLNEENFGKASVMIVTYLLNLVPRCKMGGNPGATTYERYVDSLRKTNSAKDFGELLDSMMERFNNTYKPELEEEHEEHPKTDNSTDQGHEDHDDHGAKCASADAILRDLKTSKDASVTEHLTEKISALFIAYFLKNVALKKECVLLPSRKELLDDIFTLLDAKTNMSEKQLIQLLEKLKIGKDSGQANHDGHNHRRKRSISPTLNRKRRGAKTWMADVMESMTKRELSESDHETLNLAKRETTNATMNATRQCLDVHQLMTVHNIEEDSGISRSQFVELCPALIQQQISGACSVKPTPSNLKSYASSESYGYGTLLVLIISLLAMLGAILVPFLNTSLYNNLIIVFIALAVSTMCGDALLHLMPQALGLHVHDGESVVETEHSDEFVEPFVWKQLVIVGSIYLFFLIEALMGLLKSRGESEEEEDEDGHNHGHGHSHSLPNPKRKPNKSVTNGDVIQTNNKNSNGNVGMENPAFTPPVNDLSLAELGVNSSNYRVRSSRDESQLESNEEKWSWRQIKSVAIMILLGDTLHNFIDGVAIGAAFAQDLNSGISTSIAVFCHELPHELGDFAVLISTGMPVKWALLLNLMSALTCFVGLYIGLAIAVDLLTRQWIFALTSGMFLYVGLVNMLPELMRHRTQSKVKTFILQNIGLLLGFGIMLLISIFEDKITIG